MSARAPEQLRIAYRERVNGVMVTVNQVTIDRIPKRFFPASPSKEDGTAIADALIRIAPGTNFHDHTLGREILVERVHPGLSGIPQHETLEGWERKARAPYELQIEQLRLDLVPMIKVAARTTKRQVDQERRHRVEERGFTWGKTRARIYARAFLGRNALRASKLAGDALRHEEGNVDGLVRRTLRVLDPEDVIHGIGADLVERIEVAQSGAMGVAVQILEDEYPMLTNIANAIVLGEKLSSPDTVVSKGALGFYEGVHEVGTFSHKMKPTTRRGKIGRGVLHLLEQGLWPNDAVVEEELLRRQEIQDRSALTFIHMIVTDHYAPQKSLAYQRFQWDTAASLVLSLERPRTKIEKAERTLQGSSELLEQEIVSRLPAHMAELFTKILHHGQSEEQLAVRRQLKDLDINGSTLSFIQKLDEVAGAYGVSDTLSADAKALWAQTRQEAQFILDTYTTARTLITPVPQQTVEPVLARNDTAQVAALAPTDPQE